MVGWYCRLGKAGCLYIPIETRQKKISNRGRGWCLLILTFNYLCLCLLVGVNFVMTGMIWNVHIRDTCHIFVVHCMA